MVQKKAFSLLRKLAAAAAGILIGGLFFHLAVMPLVVRHGHEVSVPDLRRLGLEESIARIEEIGLRLGERSEVFDPQVPAGEVVRQDPPPGFRVKKGREVRLLISLGPETLRVPLVAGESLEHARFLLLQAGLEPGKIRTVHGTGLPGNRVVAASPRPGSPLMGRRRVDLLVSLGPPPERYLMPDLRGREAPPVADLLSGAGFQVRRGLWSGARGSGKRIREQTPPPGYPIEAGGTVELILGR